MRATRLGGLILAGGAGRRLGGADKPMLDVAGAPLLERALAALNDVPRVLVGSQRPGFARERWTVERPPGAGPVAAIAAGLAQLPRERDPVAILAGDLLAVTPDTVLRLCESLTTEDGAVLVDADGRRQWLISVWRTPVLREALPADPIGVSVRGALGALSVCEVAERPGESRDLDTPDDLARVRGTGE